MPELPEVEVVLGQLKPRALGTRVQRLALHRSDIVRQGHEHISWFPGSTITDITRRGKCLIFTCQKGDDSRHLLSELGMTGLWLFQASLAASPQHIHASLIYSDDGDCTLHYWNPRRFGRLWLLSPSESEKWCTRRFGPDSLTMNEQTFMGLVRSSRGRIKPWLLNQRQLAGIGNIYANEILFGARIHPNARGYRLTKATCHRLFMTLQTLLQKAINAGGSSIRDFQAPDGTRGKFQDSHQVYQKEGFPCPRGCPTPIQRLQGERSSFFCPACQGHR